MNYLRRVGRFWRLQIRLAREWQPESHHRWRRLLLVWLVDALALIFVIWLLPGVRLEYPEAGLGFKAIEVAVFVAFVGLVNAFIRPVIMYLALPLAFMTAGLFAIVLNTILLQLTSAVVGGVIFDSFWWALLASILTALANTFISFVVNLNDDDSYYFALLQQMSAQAEGAVKTDRPGLVVLQVDGLAAPIIRQAIRTGTMPFLASSVRSGGHRLIEWEAGLPSNTPASQAGILHGNNHGIPAFRWYDKETGRILVANHPKDAKEIEQSISTRRGLLADNGVSLVNLFSGNATVALMTNSRIAERSDVGQASRTFYAFLLSPYQLTRTIVLLIREVVVERYQARRQVVRDVLPRVHRDLAFAGMRAAACVAFPDVIRTSIVEGMFFGRNIMYADMLAYDELAHHAGPERPETMAQLETLDVLVRSLTKAAKGAPRPYEFAMLSDHGQSMGATFKQRYGTSLQDLVSDYLSGDVKVIASAEDEESWGQVNMLMAEVVKAPGLTSAVTRAALGKRVAADGTVEVRKGEQQEEKRHEAELEEGVAEAIVLPSGNFATIHLTASKTRMTLEEIEERYPGLVTSLAAHPGIAFVMVATGSEGPVVLGREGTRYLADDRVVGKDPLRHFRGRPADALRRVDSFPNCADICVNSVYDPETEEVAAFEEQVGCHGGLGGYQTRPFVLVPSSWTVPDEDLFGAESIYEIFRRRLDEAVLSEEEIGARSEEQEGRTIEGAAEFDAEMAAADRAAASAASDAADARAMDSGVPPGHQEPPTG
jgi:uncharacterized membrane protein YvlD (DUF360 family)